MENASRVTYPKKKCAGRFGQPSGLPYHAPRTAPLFVRPYRNRIPAGSSPVHDADIRKRPRSGGAMSWRGGSPLCCSCSTGCCCCGSLNGSCCRCCSSCCSSCRPVSRGSSLFGRYPKCRRGSLAALLKRLEAASTLYASKPLPPQHQRIRMGNMGD